MSRVYLKLWNKTTRRYRFVEKEDGVRRLFGSYASAELYVHGLKKRIYRWVAVTPDDPKGA